MHFYITALHYCIVLPVLFIWLWIFGFSDHS